METIVEEGLETIVEEGLETIVKNGFGDGLATGLEIVLKTVWK